MNLNFHVFDQSSFEYLRRFRELAYPNSTVPYLGATDIDATLILSNSLPSSLRTRSSTSSGNAKKNDPFKYMWFCELFKDSEGIHDTEAQSLLIRIQLKTNNKNYMEMIGLTFDKKHYNGVDMWRIGIKEYTQPNLVNFNLLASKTPVSANALVFKSPGNKISTPKTSRKRGRISAASTDSTSASTDVSLSLSSSTTTTSTSTGASSPLQLSHPAVTDSTQFFRICLNCRGCNIITTTSTEEPIKTEETTMSLKRKYESDSSAL